MRAPRLLVAITLAGLLAAGSAPAWSLDLMQAYQAALAQDARIRAARAARDSAIERLPQARAQLLPNIAINLGRNKNDIDRTQENALGRDDLVWRGILQLQPDPAAAPAAVPHALVRRPAPGRLRGR
ncbi:hypothetical protein MASR2M16_00440 [Thauera terpenica]